MKMSIKGLFGVGLVAAATLGTAVASAHVVTSGTQPAGTAALQFTHFGPFLQASLWVGPFNATWVRSDTNANYFIAAQSTCNAPFGGGSSTQFSGWVNVNGPNQWAITPICPFPQSVVNGIGAIFHT